MYGGNRMSPFSFTAPADGRYEFFPKFTEQENEAMRSEPEAYTVVDTAPATDIR